MKVHSYKTLEDAAVEVLKKNKQPMSAKRINNKILDDYTVVRIRTSSKKLAPRLNKNPRVGALCRGREKLYFLI